MQETVNDIQPCLDTLQQGGSILFNFHGHLFVACDATNDWVIEKLLAVFTHQKENCILVAGESELMKFASTIDLAMFDFIDEQEQPVKILLDGVIGLAENATNYGVVQVVLVKDPFCNTLLKRLKKPLFAIDVTNFITPDHSIQSKITLTQVVDFVTTTAFGEPQIPLIFNTFKWVGGAPYSL